MNNMATTYAGTQIINFIFNGIFDARGGQGAFSASRDDIFYNCEKFMYLKIFVEDEGLKQKYIMAANAHNLKMFENPFPDAGFDIFNPDDYLTTGPVNKINFKVKTCAQMVCQNMHTYYTGFYMYPRSSLSKTKLRLANSVGIIDSGYRGDLIGAFDNTTPNENFIVNKHDKLVQICAPGLVPVYVKIVEKYNDLSPETERGAGGFGSTGR
jgi:dUTP pyrophosphatase